MKGNDMYRIEELITIASEKGASDVHLIAGLPPKCRIDGLITNLTEETLTHEDCEEYGRQLAGEDVSECCHRGTPDPYQPVPPAGLIVGGTPAFEQQHPTAR